MTLNLFTSAISSELASTISRIQASFVLVQDQEQVDKLLEQSGNLPHVKAIIYVDPTGMRSYAGNRLLVSFHDLLDLGIKHESRHPGLFAEELSKGKVAETAHMILTSGTDLPSLPCCPTGTTLGHGQEMDRFDPGGYRRQLAFHDASCLIVDQMWGFGVALLGGMTMNFPETPETVEADFREIGPDLLISSSRFWEDLASRIRVKIDDAGFINRTAFTLAERIGTACVDLKARQGWSYP